MSPKKWGCLSLSPASILLSVNAFILILPFPWYDTISEIFGPQNWTKSLFCIARLNWYKIKFWDKHNKQRKKDSGVIEPASKLKLKENFDLNQICNVWSTVGPLVRRTKDKRPQAVRYRRIFPWDVDIAIFLEWFKRARNQTVPRSFLFELCLHRCGDILIYEDIRQDARSSDRTATPKLDQ